jgi:hypothetical protein
MVASVVMVVVVGQSICRTRCASEYGEGMGSMDGLWHAQPGPGDAGRGVEGGGGWWLRRGWVRVSLPTGWMLGRDPSTPHAQSACVRATAHKGGVRPGAVGWGSVAVLLSGRPADGLAVRDASGGGWGSASPSVDLGPSCSQSACLPACLPDSLYLCLLYLSLLSLSLSPSLCVRVCIFLSHQSALALDLNLPPQDQRHVRILGPDQSRSPLHAPAHASPRHAQHTPLTPKQRTHARTHAHRGAPPPHAPPSSRPVPTRPCPSPVPPPLLIPPRQPAPSPCPLHRTPDQPSRPAVPSKQQPVQRCHPDHHHHHPPFNRARGRPAARSTTGPVHGGASSLPCPALPLLTGGGGAGEKRQALRGKQKAGPSPSDRKKQATDRPHQPVHAARGPRESPPAPLRVPAFRFSSWARALAPGVGWGGGPQCTE